MEGKDIKIGMIVKVKENGRIGSVDDVYDNLGLCSVLHEDGFLWDYMFSEIELFAPSKKTDRRWCN